MKIIKSAIKARRAEIELSEINIFNFEHAAAQIGDNPEFAEYKKDLLKRAVNERHQMRRSQYILDALLAQQVKRKPWWRLF